ncbi:MAG: outer membrane protein, partial [Terricaulis silvestris]
MMKSRITQTVALAALMTGVAGAAHATEGWYGRADVGYSLKGDFDVEDGTGLYSWGQPDLEKDWTEGVGLGYAFSNGLRFEGEISHRFNQIERIPSFDQGGDVHVWSAMFNGYYDFNKGGSIQPYIGGGVGSARVNANGADDIPPPHFSFDDSDTVIAWQAMAGVAFAVSDQLDLDVGYRYFSAQNVEFTANDPTATDRQADYKNTAVTVGLRWQFAAPPPPPAPPPPVVAPPPPPV